MDHCLLNTCHVVCISCVIVYPVMFYSSQGIGTNLIVHRCIWSEGLVDEHLFSHWVSIPYTKFGTVYSKKYKNIFWIENPTPIQSWHHLLYQLPKIQLVYLCCVNFLVCAMEHRNIVVQMCHVSASHVCCCSWFQSSRGAVGTTAAQNTECCWAKQSCAEPSGERRHQRKARNGGSQMSTFCEDTKVCTALHVPVVISSQGKVL